jgi:hypothetical protein
MFVFSIPPSIALPSTPERPERLCGWGRQADRATKRTHKTRTPQGGAGRTGGSARRGRDKRSCWGRRCFRRGGGGQSGR